MVWSTLPEKYYPTGDYVTAICPYMTICGLNVLGRVQVI